MQSKISFLSGISEQPLLDAGYQNALVANLSDIIVHLNYIIRDA
ncbi:MULTISPECIES: hypothetical protein [Photorhabdus]|nr:MULTISPECIES: hypothetical protein [Photorhabdus]